MEPGRGSGSLLCGDWREVKRLEEAVNLLQVGVLVVILGGRRRGDPGGNLSPGRIPSAQWRHVLARGVATAATPINGGASDPGSRTDRSSVGTAPPSRPAIVTTGPPPP